MIPAPDSGVSSPAGKWPKQLRPLSAEEQTIHNDFMKRWHEVLPAKYGIVDRFNHSFPVDNSRPGFGITLEIGAGLGEHLRYERLSSQQEAQYYALEMRENMAARIAEEYPGIHVMVGDCQERLDFADGAVDRCLAIHVLEHLPDLPRCVAEVWRLLAKDRGQFLAVIPCEGGLAYSVARRVSAQRIFEATYKVPYGPFIAREHINVPREILDELAPYFVVERARFFPFSRLRWVAVNLCMGLALRPRPNPLPR
jgi:SAM-dependent methyltransferase